MRRCRTCFNRRSCCRPNWHSNRRPLSRRSCAACRSDEAQQPCHRRGVVAVKPVAFCRSRRRQQPLGSDSVAVGRFIGRLLGRDGGEKVSHLSRSSPSRWDTWDNDPFGPSHGGTALDGSVDGISTRLGEVSHRPNLSGRDSGTVGGSQLLGPDRARQDQVREGKHIRRGHCTVPRRASS